MLGCLVFVVMVMEFFVVCCLFGGLFFVYFGF